MKLGICPKFKFTIFILYIKSSNYTAILNPQIYNWQLQKSASNLFLFPPFFVVGNIIYIFKNLTPAKEESQEVTVPEQHESALHSQGAPQLKRQDKSFDLTSPQKGLNLAFICRLKESRLET